MKIEPQKLFRFMLAGGPAFALAVPLNYLLVQEAGWNKAPAYAVVLAVQITVNFLICRAFVFERTEIAGLFKSFAIFLQGNVLFRLADWLVYVWLTKHFGLPYLGVQLFNVALFALLKFEFAKWVFEGGKRRPPGIAGGRSGATGQEAWKPPGGTLLSSQPRSPDETHNPNSVSERGTDVTRNDP